MTSALQELLDRYVADGTVPGAVASLGTGEPEFAASGATGFGGPPMRADAIFRIKSLTKAVTAVAALRLVEAGRLDLDEPVHYWLPELPHGLTTRHLLTCTSGYGIELTPGPRQQAMQDAGVESDVGPIPFGADEWLERMAALKPPFPPGQGWRYHHSFGILGILLSRLTGRPLHEHLTEDLFRPLDMPDTGMWAPADQAGRLPAAYAPDTDAVLEPAGGGFYAGPPPFDVSHGELVSTIHDFTRFIAALTAGHLVSDEHLRMMTTDQVPDEAKTPDSFFPGFWDANGWGFGVCVVKDGRHQGRWGWSGGLGTDFFADDNAQGVLLTQRAMGARMQPLLEDFQELA